MNHARNRARQVQFDVELEAGKKEYILFVVCLSFPLGAFNALIVVSNLAI